MDDKYQNPGTAAVLSFVFTGLGQIYNGEIKKGLWLMFISAASILCLIIGAIITGTCLLNIEEFGPPFLFAGLFLIATSILIIVITGVYNIYDAYNRASLKK